MDLSMSRRFFLGANTPAGFVSRMDQLTEPERFDAVYILKGGPGSGKSTLLARVAEEALARGRSPELICCSFSPESLDAVVVDRVVVLDGTAPHIVDCRYPGAFEQLVCLGDCWDGALLAEQREGIIALNEDKKRLCAQACRYLAAADALLGDTHRLALETTDTAKIDRLASRIAATEFKQGHAGQGREKARLLSALTASGPVLLEQTASQLADRLYLLEDDWGPSASLLLAELRRHALAAGLDAICCYSPLAPYERLEQLFLPSLSLGFLTVNDRLRPTLEPYRVINSRRFTDKALLNGRKKRIAFNRKAATRMFAQAQGLLAEAGELHRRLEACYRPAMDFSAVDALTERLLARIF